jgi:predicted O-linked N-acetylglucosamine transferase (SPINDLY family)
MDALVHRLPIVTLPGQTMRSRHGAAILSLMGLEHLICPTADAYVDAAARLASAEARAAAKRILEQNLCKLANRSAISALERHIADSVFTPAAGPE